MPEADAEILTRLARDVDAPAAGQDEVEQLADLKNVSLAADALRGHFVAFEEDGVAPVDQLEVVMFSIPKQVLGVDVVVNNVVSVGVVEQVEQVVDGDQHLQFGHPLAALRQFEHEIGKDGALGALHDDVLVHHAADRELSAAEQRRQHGVTRQPRQRLALVEDADFLPGADRRRVLRRGTLDHDRAVVLLNVDGAQRLTGASARVNVIITVTIIKKAVSHQSYSPNGYQLYALEALAQRGFGKIGGQFGIY